MYVIWANSKYHVFTTGEREREGRREEGKEEEGGREDTDRKKHRASMGLHQKSSVYAMAVTLVVFWDF